MRNNSITYRLSTFLMAFLMLFSSVGFSMDVHYCQGGIENVSFFGKADVCDMMREVKQKDHACCSSKKKSVSHCSKNDSEVTKGKCCHNESFNLESIDDSNTSDELQLEGVNLTFTTVFLLHSIFFSETELQVNNYFNYVPPPLIEDVIILHQVFII